MDPSDSASGSTEQQKDDHDKALTTSSLDLMEFPEDIVRMVFTEFMSKPAIHFAEFELIDIPQDPSNYQPLFGDFADTIRLMVLSRWSEGNIKSGYVSSETLQKTCSLARDVVRRTTAEPSIIRYQDGSKTVDASVDVLCLVERRGGLTPVPYFYSASDDGNSHTWDPTVNHEQTAAQLGSIRRAGVRVSDKIWWDVLGNWFSVEIDEYDEPVGMDEPLYQGLHGDLHRTHLGMLMTCFLDLRSFYLILTDVTWDDWDTYYASFPIAFHDHNGSYVMVQEKPTHPSVLRDLWCRGLGPKNEEYPYPEDSAYFGTNNDELGSRVDALMEPQQRDSLLLALLHNAKSEAQHKKDMNGVTLGILARKPSAPARHTDVDTSSNSVTIPKDEYFVGVDLQPGDPEAKWVKQALGRIMRESDEMYEKESVSNEEEQ